jgi:hypothetical protein
LWRRSRSRAAGGTAKAGPPLARGQYLHTVEGRDAEIASALSELAAHGDAARRPKSIVSKTLMGHARWTLVSVVLLTWECSYP